MRSACESRWVKQHSFIHTHTIHLFWRSSRNGLTHFSHTIQQQDLRVITQLMFTYMKGKIETNDEFNMSKGEN